MFILCLETICVNIYLEHLLLSANNLQSMNVYLIMLGFMNWDTLFDGNNFTTSVTIIGFHQNVYTMVCHQGAEYQLLTKPCH